MISTNQKSRRAADHARIRTRGAAPGQSDAHSTRATEMVATLQKIVHEGNVRRIFIDDEHGRTLIEIPHLLGIRGGLHMDPVWAAARALSHVVTNLTVRVEREEAWPKYDE